MLLHKLKNFLLRLGSQSLLTQLALILYGFFRGFRIRFKKQNITLSEKKKEMMINPSEIILIPFLVEFFDNFFETMVGQRIEDKVVLDFSQPGIRIFKRDNIQLLYPGVPEEDGMDAYTFKFKPQDGMIIFDAGAHVGFVTYCFSKLVGDSGKVYAFEPDDTNRKYLIENTKNLGNVEVLGMALSGATGRAFFNMGSCINSSFIHHAAYPDSGIKKEVETITLEDACNRLEVIPNFIKMDIEGAEIEVVESSLEFLRKNPIHLVFDTHHKTAAGELTYHKIEELLNSIGYKVETSQEFGATVTWGTPPCK